MLLQALVGKKEWRNNYSRFVGILPASGEDVLVQVKCEKKTGAGVMTICCDSTMALNSLLAFLKKAV